MLVSVFQCVNGTSKARATPLEYLPTVDRIIRVPLNVSLNAPLSARCGGEGVETRRGCGEREKWGSRDVAMQQRGTGRAVQWW